MKLGPKRTTHKVLLAVYATLVVLCAVIISIAHVKEQGYQRKQAEAKLRSITSTLSDQLSTGHIKALLERYDGRGMVIKNTQDAWYYVLHERLRKAADRNGLSLPLQVVIHDSLKRETQVLVTSADQPTFRMPWTGGELDLNLTRGKSHVDKTSKELVVQDPMRDESGAVVAMIVGRVPLAEAEAAVLATSLRNIVLALILFGIAGFLLFRYVGGWLKQEEKVHEKLQERHADITDSIAYAGKIQRSLVPSALVYDELFADSFVIDRPKDVVSGDFHWVHRIDADTCYVAAADCTGHGLPGAMMAAIGCSVLNEVIPQHASLDPAELLSILHERLVAVLNQEGKQRGAGDGMDVALCRVDRRNNEILFAGAYRPLYWLHQGQLSVINGDRRPVGGGHQDGERKFTCHRLAYTAGDRIYLFSDGYVDQFGGPDRKRFMTSRLHALISTNQHLPMKEQAAVFDRTFLEWKGSEDQMDDVSMLGLAV